MCVVIYSLRAYLNILITGRVTHSPEGRHVLSAVLQEPEGMPSAQCCSQREDVLCDHGYELLYNRQVQIQIIERYILSLLMV